MGNVKHAFQSGKADGGDADLVRPSNWNAAHEGAMEILDRDFTQIDVENDASETSIYSHSIDADLLGADGGVRLHLAGDMLVNAAGTLLIRVKFGATTVIATGAQDLSNYAERYIWTMDVLLMNVTASTQKASVEGIFATSAVSGALLLSDNVGIAHIIGYGTAAEDTTGALTLDVTADWSAASASLSFRKELALLELIPAS